MKRSISSDDDANTNISPSLKKQKSDQNITKLNLLVRDYDPFVLRHVFTFCSYKDLSSLARVCKEWNEFYFTREKILAILKEWIDRRWKMICGDKFLWDWKINSEIGGSLDYWPRLLKVLEIEKSLLVNEGKEVEEKEHEGMGDEQDEQEEEEQEEEQEEDEEEDDEGEEEEDEKEEDEPVVITREPMTDHSEFIEIDNVKLCKINSSTKIFTIISEHQGAIIRFKRGKKGELSCLFYGNLAYPSLEGCNYRSDFWVTIENHPKGILSMQLQQMIQYLGLSNNDYSIALHFISIIGYNTKISSLQYTDYSWDEGEAAGIIDYVPWEIVTASLNEKYDISYLCSDTHDQVDVCSILDDRFFNCFPIFCKFIRVINHLETPRPVLWNDISKKLDDSFLKNREILQCIGPSSKKLFKQLDESLRHDPEFIKEALQRNPTILKYILKKEYKDIITIDRELILDCMRRGLRLSQLPNNIIDKEIIYAAIRGGCTIGEIPEEYRNDLEIITRILKKDSFSNLQKVSGFIFGNIDNTLEIIKYSPHSIRWIKGDLLEKHPETYDTLLKYWYNIQHFKKITPELEEKSFKSLTEFLKRPGKKIKITFEFGIGKKESKIMEINERKLQPIFLIERVSILKPYENYSYKLRQIYGIHAEEKGYNAKLKFNFEEAKEVDEQLISQTLESLSNSWKREVNNRYITLVESFLKDA